MADLEISEFTNGNVPTDTNFVGGYKDANTIGGNRRWSFANISSYISTKLSLGTIVTQDADDVTITGGNISGVTITDLDGALDLNEHELLNASYITGIAGSFISPTNAPGDNMFLAAWDVDGSITVTFGELTSNNTPSLTFSQPAGSLLRWDGGDIGNTAPVSIRGHRPRAATINGTTYTLIIDDSEYFQVCNNALMQVITIPANGDVAFPISSEIDFFQQGVGQVAFVGDVGVTVQSAFGVAPKIAVQFGAATIKKIGTDTWAVIGNISA